MTKKERFQQYFMKVAMLTASNSHAKRTKVGAVLVKDGRLVASGWNGQPKGFDNCCEREDIDDQGNKILVTLPTVIHSEANLLMFCAKHGIKTDGTDLYVTLSPCINCGILIIQAGIKNVYYNEVYRDTSGIEFLQNAGVMAKKIDVIDQSVQA